MGMREGAKGLMSARCGVYPPGRTCSVDSALPTVNRPGALHSRWDSSIFSRISDIHTRITAVQVTARNTDTHTESSAVNTDTYC